MSAAPEAPASILPWALHHWSVVVLSVGVGLAVGGGAAFAVPGVTACLLGWCAAALLNTALLTAQAMRATPESMRHWALRLDDSKWVVIGGTLAAVVASLAAVVLELATHHDRFSVGLAVVTLFVSWTFLQVTFAHHYAHEHWLTGTGLDFPGCERPDFFEFLYVAFGIGMTFQVADCTTRTAGMRRLVLAHSVLSFIYTAGIVSAAVNLAAGLAAP